MENKSQEQQQLLAKERSINPNATIANKDWPQKWANLHHTLPIFILHFGTIHFFGFFGLEAILGGNVKVSSVIYALVLAEASMFGVTAGIHRYWSHRSYKAKTPLRIILAACFILSGQNSIWLWAAWHRVHHKHVDTDADPHNSTRGFFYSHIGWFFLHDYRQFRQNLKKIDMSDLENDPIVRLHERYAMALHFAAILIPSSVLWYFSHESFYTCFCLDCLRVVFVSHRTFLINSAAHMFGSKPYDTSIHPSENKFVSLVAGGEGWHNYHHVFPWDYKAAEIGIYRWNFSTALIDLFAWIGWAYDLKSVSHETVMKRVRRTGDPHLLQGGPWGWGDVDALSDHVAQTQITYTKN